MQTSSSSAQQARQILADRLRDLRRDAGLTAVELAARAGWERTKVSKIEHASRPPSSADIRTWCQVCGADGEVPDLVASLRAAEGMWVEWRRMERSGLRRAQEARLPLYERTLQFRAYSCWKVPGLIQTEDYTRAVLRAYQQRRGLRDDVEEAVAARMRRQRVLRRNQRTAAFLIEENVLRNGFGGPEVMHGQLARLAEVTTWPAVSLGVIPASPDRGMAGSAEDFWIFDNEQVNVELISGYLTVTQPTEIALYAQMFARLGEIAVYGSRARDLIDAVNQLGLEPRATLRHTTGRNGPSEPTVAASPRSARPANPYDIGAIASDRVAEAEGQDQPMTTGQQVRCCGRCATRLARDNPGVQCAACTQLARDAMLHPPTVPQEFWDQDQMRAALAAWHMGHVIRAYRNHPYHGRALSQELVANWFGLTQTQLSRIENGKPPEELSKLVRWATLLRIPAHLLWFKLPGTQCRSPPARI